MTGGSQFGILCGSKTGRMSAANLLCTEGYVQKRGKMTTIPWQQQKGWYNI